MKNLKKLTTMMLFLVVSFGSYHLNVPGNTTAENYLNKEAGLLLQDLQAGRLPIEKWVQIVRPGMQTVFAEDVGDSSCNTINSTARTTCMAQWSGYSHGALSYFNGTLCRLNKEATSEIEGVLCHFRKSMGVKVDLAALPLSATKTFNSMTIVVDIAAPAEAWAVSAGYQAKGTVTVNGSTYMVLYWGGKEASTKGFMIEGFVANGLGGKRATYTKWDLTDSTAQVVKMYATDFSAGGSYLFAATKSGSSYRGDAAVYGSVNYNGTTNAVSTQVVMIEEQRNGGTAGQFGCFKMYASGIKGAAVVISKTQNSFSGSGHAVTSAAKTFAEMDGVSLTDSTTTANGTGTTYTTQSALEGAFGVSASANVFDISCLDLNSMGGVGASNLFSSSRTSLVDHTATVSAVFP